MSDLPNIDFSRATVLHNNLGGQGPDTGANNLRIGNAGTWNFKMFDIVVTSPPTYRSGRAAENGLRSDSPGFENFMWVGIETGLLCAGSYCKFNFQFLDSGTDEPMMLPEVHITAFDIDGKPGFDSELVSSKGYADYIIDGQEDLNLVESTMPNGFPGFSGTGLPREAENPTDPMKLTGQQYSNSVMYVYKDATDFDMYFGMKDDNDGRSGTRFLQFAGKSGLENQCEGFPM